MQPYPECSFCYYWRNLYPTNAIGPKCCHYALENEETRLGKKLKREKSNIKEPTKCPENEPKREYRPTIEQYVISNKKESGV